MREVSNQQMSTIFENSSDAQISAFCTSSASVLLRLPRMSVPAVLAPSRPLAPTSPPGRGCPRSSSPGPFREIQDRDGSRHKQSLLLGSGQGPPGGTASRS